MPRDETLVCREKEDARKTQSAFIKGESKRAGIAKSPIKDNRAYGGGAGEISSTHQKLYKKEGNRKGIIFPVV
jgi:hypothetical protein